MYLTRVNSMRSVMFAMTNNINNNNKEYVHMTIKVALLSKALGYCERTNLCLIHFRIKNVNMKYMQHIATLSLHLCILPHS